MWRRDTSLRKTLYAVAYVGHLVLMWQVRRPSIFSWICRLRSQAWRNVNTALGKYPLKAGKKIRMEKVWDRKQSNYHYALACMQPAVRKRATLERSHLRSKNIKHLAKLHIHSWLKNTWLNQDAGILLLLISIGFKTNQNLSCILTELPTVARVVKLAT